MARAEKEKKNKTKVRFSHVFNPSHALIAWVHASSLAPPSSVSHFLRVIPLRACYFFRFCTFSCSISPPDTSWNENVCSRVPRGEARVRVWEGLGGEQFHLFWSNNGSSHQTSRVLNAAAAASENKYVDIHHTTHAPSLNKIPARWHMSSSRPHYVDIQKTSNFIAGTCQKKKQVPHWDENNWHFHNL